MSFFDFELPENRIAQQPLQDRAASKMLHIDLQDGSLHDRAFRELPARLRSGDLLVLNDTRVTARRVFGHRATGGRVELLFLRRGGDGYWVCLVRPARRLHNGEKIALEGLDASVEILEDLSGGLKKVALGDELSPEQIGLMGSVPLPPYILEQIQDPERYQTVFARTPGSAAAPTAGLHFTPEILEEIRALGVEIAHVTLDVSLDTFRPVTSDKLDEHPMHGETCRLSESTAAKIGNCSGRIIAVGTTTVRTLESMAIGPRSVKPGEKSTRLFVRPGYKYLVIDGMVTNFHMARTTMLLMIAALAGEEPIRKAYEHALATEYRFLSFGDAMLLL